MGSILSLIAGKGKLILYILLIVVVIFLLWKFSAKIEGGFKKLFGKSGGSYDEKGQHSAVEISGLANRLYSAIYDPVAMSGTKQELFKEALTYNDTDLDKLATEYAQKSDNSLYKDIDDEFLPFVNEDETLMARLKELNKQ
jgi:hypothetical protein